MKRIIVTLLLLASFGIVTAQKVKMKKGKVFIDKKEYLTYKGDVFYSLNGVPLFTLKKETVEKVNPNKNDLNTVNSDVQTYSNRDSNANDPQRRGNRYTKPQKVKYVTVKFNTFSLEYETTLSKSKILKEFYNSKVLNAAGLVDQEVAEAVAAKLKKDISGKKN
jgi:hypothetical protein